MWGCFLMSGVKILHFLKDWWKSIPIHQNYTMALSFFFFFFFLLTGSFKYKIVGKSLKWKQLDRKNYHFLYKFVLKKT